MKIEKEPIYSLQIADHEFLLPEDVSEMQEKWNLLITTSKMLGYRISGDYYASISWERITLNFDSNFENKSLSIEFRSYCGELVGVYLEFRENFNTVDILEFKALNDFSLIVDIFDKMLSYI